KYVLAKLGPQSRQFLVDRGKALLRRLAELRAGLDEVLPRLFQNPLRLGVEPERAAPFIKRIDAGEERRVHVDRRKMPGHLRRNLALDLLDRRIGVGAGLAPEHGRGASERLAGQF